METGAVFLLAIAALLALGVIANRKTNKPTEKKKEETDKE